MLCAYRDKIFRLKKIRPAGMSKEILTTVPILTKAIILIKAIILLKAIILTKVIILSKAIILTKAVKSKQQVTTSRILTNKGRRHQTASRGILISNIYKIKKRLPIIIRITIHPPNTQII